MGAARSWIRHQPCSSHAGPGPPPQHSAALPLPGLMHTSTDFQLHPGLQHDSAFSQPSSLWQTFCSSRARQTNPPAALRGVTKLEALTVLLWSICFCGISSPAGGRRHSSFSDGKGGKGSGELSSASRTTAALPAAPHPAASPLPPPPSFCSLPIPNRVPARSREAAQSPEPPSGPEPGRAGAGSRRISLPCRPGCALAGSRWQLSQVDPLPGVTHGGSAGSNKSQAPCEAIIWSFHLPGRRRRRGLCSRCAGGERAAGEAQPRASSLRLCPQQLGSTSLPAPMEFGGSGATLAAGVVPPCKLHLPGSWELLLQLPVAAPAAAPCLPGDSLEVFGW
ncbi:uncharacterized protein [Melanerpes formicivorus]|uniref:uncharacterized protein isoform X3 n=1 Tax=Melanerpes formicivorus TaxID=211600 RepID=UPI00358FC92C